jgi:hypothetical protein
MSATQTQVQQILVSCVTKKDRTNRHESITHIGGDGWKWTTAQVIAELESAHPRYAFYTNVGGKISSIGVNDGQHGKHLQTHADGYWNNNLLALPECA